MPIRPGGQQRHVKASAVIKEQLPVALERYRPVSRLMPVWVQVAGQEVRFDEGRNELKITVRMIESHQTFIDHEQMDPFPVHRLPAKLGQDGTDAGTANDTKHRQITGGNGLTQCLGDQPGCFSLDFRPLCPDNHSVFPVDFFAGSTYHRIAEDRAKDNHLSAAATGCPRHIMTEPAQPITVFSIPVKPVLYLAVIATIVLTDIDCHRITESYEMLPFTRQHGPGSKRPSTAMPVDIVATPEMIARARQKIESARHDERENAPYPAPTDRFYYIVELFSGGNLESAELTIRPDRVILTSASGIKTVIDRRSVKTIQRIKLPQERP
jgi:hypothetical protein